MDIVKRATLDYKTTLVGLALGLSEVLGSVTDFTSLSWQELFIRTLKALPIVLLGVIARDHVHDRPEDYIAPKN